MYSYFYIADLRPTLPSRPWCISPNIVSKILWLRINYEKRIYYVPFGLNVKTKAYARKQ